MAVGSALFYTTMATAGMSLNFFPLNFQGKSITNNDSGGEIPSGTPGTADYFTQNQEIINGEYYFHVVLGDPNTGFAYEAYTRMRSGSFSGGKYYNVYGRPCEPTTGDATGAACLSPMKNTFFGPYS